MPAKTASSSRSAKARRAAPTANSTPPADPAFFHWLDFFQRYHQTNHIKMVALALDPEPVPVTENQSSRYVFEVGVKREGGNDKWMLIAWELDVPGIRLRDCKSQEEAMSLFERRYIYGPGVGTVRLRPDCRPW